MKKPDFSCQVSEPGGTNMIISVTFEEKEPFKNDEVPSGALIVSVDLGPLTSKQNMKNFRKISDDEVEISRVIDRTIRESKSIDLNKWILAKENSVVFMLVYVLILNHNGNIIDPAIMGLNEIFKKIILNKFNKFEHDIYKAFDNTKFPTSFSFVKINKKFYLDPDLDEETQSNLKLTVGMTKDFMICSAQKSGSKGITEQQIEYLFNKMEQIIKNNEN